MHNQIEIKTRFSPWRTVSEEDAKKHIKLKLENVPWRENVIEYVNTKCLRGTTVQELLKEDGIILKINEYILQNKGRIGEYPIQ